LIKDEQQLLLSAQSGDNDAINQILTNNKNLVVAIARKYFLIGGDKEDLIQEGMIGLFKAINSFSAEKNDNFVPYAITLIEREIISAIRHANTSNNQVLTDAHFVDSEDEIHSSISPESDYLSGESTHELITEIYKNLSPFEQSVVKYYLKGYTYIDIAKILNKSNKSIDNALHRIKEKLKYLKERL
jgi:RNA polymerase sporulation-specific sigma factor